MQWLVDPLVIGLLVLGAVIGWASAALRRWSLRDTAEYTAGSVVMIFGLLWALEIGGQAVYAAAVAGIGTALGTRAVERARAQTRGKAATR